MKINQTAVQSLIRSAIGNNNEAKRELIHASEYYSTAPSTHSACRLLSAAAAVVKQNEQFLFERGQISRFAFCNLIEAA